MTEPESLTLSEAADRLGVHYMTAYRYVRTGQLAARRDGATWSVAESDLSAFERARAGAPPSRPRRVDRVTRLRQRMIEGDEAGGWAIVESALASGVEPAEVYTGILIPALVEIGEGWARGTTSVAEEHRASAVAVRLVGRLGPRFVRRGRSRGTVVIGAPPGDPHSLPGALVADLLRARGFEVVDLGSDVPATSFVETAQSVDRRVAVLVGVSSPGALGAAKAVVRALHAAGVSDVLVGGGAVGDEEVARRLGADEWTGSDAEALVATLERRVAELRG